MADTEIFFEPVGVTATLDTQGHTLLQSITWQEQEYTIVAVGRQWDEENGRHIMAEAADGTRFELQLSREDLIWYVRRVWRGQLLV